MILSLSLKNKFNCLFFRGESSDDDDADEIEMVN
jgi:hypothetical protein